MNQSSTSRRSARKLANSVADASIPDKLYFRIGEVAQLCGVEAYVLRFWQSEFPALRPNKSGTGQRLYRRKDVEMALRIRHLLYEEGYTIPGARQALKQEGKQPDPTSTDETVKQQPLKFVTTTLSPAEAKINRIRQDLRALLLQLSGPPNPVVSTINSGSRENSRTQSQPPPDTALF